jgi:hypothetical protein
VALGAGVLWWSAAPVTAPGPPGARQEAGLGARPAVQPRETRATLDPALFVGKARRAHEVARAIPDVLDRLHLLLEGGAIVPVVQRAVVLFMPFSLGTPDWTASAAAPAPVVALLQVALVGGFFGLSLVAGHRRDAPTRMRKPRAAPSSRWPASPWRSRLQASWC